MARVICPKVVSAPHGPAHCIRAGYWLLFRDAVGSYIRLPCLRASGSGGDQHLGLGFWRVCSESGVGRRHQPVLRRAVLPQTAQRPQAAAWWQWSSDSRVPIWQSSPGDGFVSSLVVLAGAARLWNNLQPLRQSAASCRG